MARCPLPQLALLVSALGAAVSLPAQLLRSPGFEAGPLTSPVSFVQNGPTPLIWLASHTDGERMLGTASEPAAEGDFYACVLQNAGMHPGNLVGIGPNGATGFDRIYDTFSVRPSTLYEVRLKHASGNRFGYLAGESVITVESVTNGRQLRADVIPTPGLFQWTEVVVTFATDATTTQAALTLSCRSPRNCSALYDDIRITPCAGGAASQSARLGSPPNPDALVAPVTPPRIGSRWSPRIDHRAFLPNATLDGLVVGFGQANVPTPFGVWLCDPNAPSASLTATPGSELALSIPFDCGLIGLQLCVQGASTDGSAAALTGALDLTLGL